jgi:hypothetical protein
MLVSRNGSTFAVTIHPIKPAQEVTDKIYPRTTAEAFRGPDYTEPLEDEKGNPLPFHDLPHHRFPEGFSTWLAEKIVFWGLVAFVVAFVFHSAFWSKS